MANPQNRVQTSPSAADIVLSCAICQETISTIYAEENKRHDLSTGDKEHSGRITKLWLTECAHLLCAKHFEGVPYQPGRRAPRAPCPLCTIEKNDSSEKSLFFVCGPLKGEYDSDIPGAYFETPPSELLGADAGSEALRFQYLALLRYGLKINERSVRSATALRQWEDKKVEIIRSLSNVAPLRDALLRAGRVLLSLNHDVSAIEPVLNAVGASILRHSPDEPDMDITKETRDITSAHRSRRAPFDVGSRLAQGSAADLEALRKHSGSSSGYAQSISPHRTKQETPSTKRNCIEATSRTERQRDHSPGLDSYRNCSSRDLMPPPPVPHRQVHVHLTQLPEHNPDQGFRQYGTHTTDSLHSTGPASTLRGSDHSSYLALGFPTSSAPLPATPTTMAPHSNNLSLFDLHVPSSIRTSAYTNRQGGSAWPQYTAQANNAVPWASPSWSPPPFSSHNSHHRLAQGPNQGSLKFSSTLTGSAQTPGSVNRRIGTVSNLGLSGNARSSSRQPTLSPASLNSHRRRLGERVSASPHFPPSPDISANQTSRSPSIRPSPTHSGHIVPQRPGLINSSRFTTPERVMPERNILVEQEQKPKSERADNLANTASSMGPPAALTDSIPVFHHTHISTPRIQRNNMNHGRAQQADLQASALRRRANR